MTCHQQDKKEKDADGLGKRRKTSQSEDVSSSNVKDFVQATGTHRNVLTDPTGRTRKNDLFIDLLLLSYRRSCPGLVVTTGPLSLLS